MFLNEKFVRPSDSRSPMHHRRLLCCEILMSGQFDSHVPSLFCPSIISFHLIFNYLYRLGEGWCGRPV